MSLSENTQNDYNLLKYTEEKRDNLRNAVKSTIS